ncbi:hypothetical protein V6N11_013381 [Hibiscus sabdariffa]|uniref:Fatty acid hydroxylase domain-containing protein n=1 Tax=Hibiscus sabdariffa TaxID=183260 RepID=A0ABR2NNE3_9ROSI
MGGKGFTVDMTKPIALQVGHLGDAYQEWAHQPVLTEESPRFFESDFMEMHTRTVWWAIPAFWLPIAFWCISMSYNMGHTLPQVVSMAVLGCLVWSLAEYCFHRFLFHMDTKSYWGNTFHFLMHGCHHKFPMDGSRHVIPPSGVSVPAAMFWFLYGLWFTQSTRPALYGGGVIGYVIYDLTHYYLHHGHPTNQALKTLKKAHYSHHFRIQDKGYGITSALWDRVFASKMAVKGFTVDLNKPPCISDVDSYCVVGGASLAMLSVLGAFVWTFLEYCIHRFLFHIDTKSYWGNTFHYLIHGYHHKHPTDGLRLVIPPLEAALVIVMFWYLCRVLFSVSTGSALLGGGLAGYVIYDTIHYYLHHSHPTNQSLKILKKYHMNHHFRIQNKGFGVTTKLWDRVFETLPKTKAADKSG